MVTVKIKKLRETATIPKRMSEGASGFDVFAPEKIRLMSNHPELVPCGFAVEVPKGFELQVRPRSGLALRHGVSVVNSPGTIDADYRGEVGVILRAPYSMDIEAGERIAQLVLQQVPELNFKEVTDLGDSARGKGGFGSTNGRTS